MAVKQIADYLENGNIKNSVNYPSLDAGVCHSASRVTINHKNIPNMISQFTSVLSASNMNIENMVNKSKGEYAYTVIDVSEAVDQAIADKLNAINGVLKVRVIA